MRLIKIPSREAVKASYLLDIVASEYGQIKELKLALTYVEEDDGVVMFSGIDFYGFIDYREDRGYISFEM